MVNKETGQAAHSSVAAASGSANPRTVAGSAGEVAYTKPKFKWGPWQICWLALGIRIFVMTAFGYFHVKTTEDHYGMGWEMGRIARSLVTGHGYGNPFYGLTGPTAWITPFFPLVMAAAFKLFGVYTAAAAWSVLAFDSVLNALMIPMIWATGERLFGSKTARWSAWVWALYPAAMQYAVKWFWEMTLTAFLFQAALLLALIMRGVGDPPPTARDNAKEYGPTWKRWLGFGVLWGLIALSNPGVLLFLPICGVWILAARGRGWSRDLPKAVAAGLIFLAMVAPWTYRNWLAFHTFIPLRTNFGAELYLGNGPEATGFLMEYNHPNVSEIQHNLYEKMGEVAYSNWRGTEAKAIIRQDVPRFLRLCLKRIYFFWASIPDPAGHALNDFFRGLNYGFVSFAGLLGLGLALKRRVTGAGLLAGAFLTLPAVYYLTTAHARFRHPLEPIMTVLIVYLFQQAEPRWGFSLSRSHGAPMAMAPRS